MRYMAPTAVQSIIADALEATYNGEERMLGTVPAVYGPGGQAWSLSLYVERTVGQPGNFTLQGHLARWQMDV